MLFNLNGSFVEADKAQMACNDGAVLFGDSLFETLKAREGQIEFLDEHLDRLELAARLLHFHYDRSMLQQALQTTAQRLAAPLARLRLTLCRGPMSSLALPSSDAGHFFISASPYQEPDANERQVGTSCVFAPNQRVNPLSHLPQMKRGNYADCLYAADHARRNKAREALFLTDTGEVLEGATSNLFILKDGQLRTPPAGELVLAGIMRRQVLCAAEHLNLPAIEQPICKHELLDAEEAFLSNSLIGLLPIARIERHPLRRGPWADRLAQLIAVAAADSRREKKS